MAGGDLNIRGTGGGLSSIGALAAKVGRIDANSTQSGSFTEKAEVGGQTVWLTPAGAKALNEAKGNGGDGTLFELKAEKDPGWFSQWWNGTKERADTLGKP